MRWSRTAEFISILSVQRFSKAVKDTALENLCTRKNAKCRHSFGLAPIVCAAVGGMVGSVEVYKISADSRRGGNNL